MTDWVGLFGIIFGGAGLLGTIGGFVYLKPRLRKEDSEADKAKHDARMAEFQQELDTLNAYREECKHVIAELLNM